VILEVKVLREAILNIKEEIYLVQFTRVKHITQSTNRKGFMPYKDKNIRKEYLKTYYQKNKEKIKQRVRKYNIENKEVIKKRNARWRKENKEKIREYRLRNRETRLRKKKEWNKENKEHVKKYQEKWRGKNKKAIEEYNKNKYINNREEEIKKVKEYQKKNRAKILDYKRRFREENKELLALKQKEYLQTEKGKANLQRCATKRRAREREIINTLTSEEWLQILEDYDYKCAYCGCEFNEDTLPTRDHVIPISKGGHNTKENVIPACLSCNAKKGNKILKERRFI